MPRKARMVLTSTRVSAPASRTTSGTLTEPSPGPQRDLRKAGRFAPRRLPPTPGQGPPSVRPVAGNAETLDA
jgi:hypothetical protein